MKYKGPNKRELYLKGYEESQCVLLRLGGMYVKRDRYQVLNKLYVCVYLGVFLSCVFIITPVSFSESIPRDDSFATFMMAHFSLVMFGYSGSSIMYHWNRRSIDRVLLIIGRGFYTYQDSGPDEEADIIVKKNKDFLKKLTKFMVPNAVLAGSLVMFVPPFVELVNLGGAIPETAVLNPYLPIPAYFPWDCFSVAGFLGAYLIMLSATIGIVLQLLALSLGYSSFMITCITQFELLNHKIERLEERATRLYRSQAKTRALRGTAKFDDPLFQAAMRHCLRQNIQHHQVLLSWMKEAQNFIGWALLTTFLATSVLLATTGYLFLMANDSIFKLLTLIEVQVLELMHSYLFCWWGENLTTESSKIPTSLFSTPWIHCDRKFKKMFHIMLANSLDPVVPRDKLLKLKASMEMYGTMIRTAYTYFNLMRSAN